MTFLQVSLTVSVVVEHIPGRLNVAADALSMDNCSVLFSLLPQATRVASHQPSELVALLLDLEGAWTSRVWTGQLKSCSSMVFQPAQGATTPLPRRDMLRFVPRLAYSPPCIRITLATECLQSQSILGYLLAGFSVEGELAPSPREKWLHQKGVAYSQA